MRTLQLDDQADVPPVWRQQTIGARRLDYRGWPKPTSTGNTGQQRIQANPAGTLRPGRGCQQGNREGPGPRRHFHKEHGPGAGRGTCRNPGKGLGVHHRGSGPDGQKASHRRTGKGQTSRPGPAPQGGQAGFSGSRASQAPPKDGQPDGAESKTGRAAQNPSGRPRTAWRKRARLGSSRKPTPSRTKKPELNYEEFMHIGKMLEHFVGLTNNAGTSEGFPVRRKLPGGAVVAERDPLGGEAFRREARRTLAVLGDKAIQMRAAAAAATPTSPADSLPTRQEGACTPNTEDEAQAASATPVQPGKDTPPAPVTPRGAGERRQRWRGLPTPSPDPHDCGLDRPRSNAEPSPKPRGCTDERHIGDIVLREHTSCIGSSLVLLFLASFVPIFWLFFASLWSSFQVSRKKTKASLREPASAQPASAAQLVLDQPR